MWSKQGHEAAAAIQVRDDGSLDQDGIDGGDEACFDSGCILMVDLTTFTDRLDICCEKKRGVKADCQTSYLSNLKNLITIY